MEKTPSLEIEKLASLSSGRGHFVAENHEDDGGGVKLLLLKAGEEMEWEERERKRDGWRLGKGRTGFAELV